mgnify:CR=1 FL=1
MDSITDEYMQEMMGHTKEYSLVILKAGPAIGVVGANKIIWEHGRRNFSLRKEGVLSIVCPLTNGSGISGVGIFNAGMGYFNRAAFVTGQGTVLGDGKSVPTLEEIHRHWDSINDISEAEEFPNATAAFGPMLDAFSPQKKGAEPAPGEALLVRARPGRARAGARAGRVRRRRRRTSPPPAHCSG